MPREILPHRRYNRTQALASADGLTFIATVSFDENDKPREVFLSGAKTGADISAILDDVSVVVSVALQHGITARAMAHSVSPRRASVIGAALELIAMFEEHGPDYEPKKLRVV